MISRSISVAGCSERAGAVVGAIAKRIDALEQSPLPIFPSREDYGSANGPGGATTCGEGREPLGKGKHSRLSPGGGTPFSSSVKKPLSPLRGFSNMTCFLPAAYAAGYTPAPLLGLNQPRGEPESETKKAPAFGGPVLLSFLLESSV